MRKLLAVLLLTACGPGTRNDNPSIDAPPTQVDAPEQVDTSRVYAHSGTTLYRLNNLTLSAQQIGTMTGLDAGLLDLAIDKDEKIVGNTRDTLYSINASTGAITMIRTLAASAKGLTSLSYVPEDPDDPASPDILISANNMGQVVKINPTTGEATVIGNYGMAPNGDVIKSSGDIFGIRGYGIFATVDVGTGTSDYLAKLDPKNGWKAAPIGFAGTGFDKIFGIGYWGGKIYGFVDNGFENNMDKGGRIIQIDATTGAATEISAAPIRWFGAGVSTAAPIL
jgi:hypothetical protein